MGYLREKMKEDMLLKGYGEKTIKGYVGHVKDIAAYLRRHCARTCRHTILGDLCSFPRPAGFTVE